MQRLQKDKNISKQFKEVKGVQNHSNEFKNIQENSK